MSKVLDLGDGALYVPLDMLSSRLRVPASTLRRWAAEDNWPKRKIQGRVYYLWSAANRAYAERGRRFRDTRRRGA